MTFTTTTNVNETKKLLYNKGFGCSFAPFNYLTNMALVIDIEKAIAGNECVIALGIKRAIATQVPAKRLLKEIREMIQDNWNIMADILGLELVKRISNGV